MRKPSNVVYGVEERPPLGVTVVSGLQHAGLMSMFLLYPVLIARAADAPVEVAAAMVSFTLIAMAIGTVLQVIRLGPFGSGYLCAPIPSIVYLVPSLVVAKQAGLETVFGMTIAAGLFEMALARALRPLRPIFPPEIIGVVVLIVGVATGLLGLRIAFGGGGAGAVEPAELWLGLVTLGLMVALNVWGGGFLRIFCVLIGMTAGYLLAGVLGIIPQESFDGIAKAQVLAIPDPGYVGWKLDLSYALPFAVAGVAATLKVMGNVATCQKADNADWVRVSMGDVTRGVLADGAGTVLAGVVGAQGLNSSPTVVGLATASGVLSRRVGYSIAAILFALAFLPKIGALFYLMPRMIAASALIFSSTFIVVNGLQVMTSRLLDARKTLVIGLALLAAFAVDAQPELLRSLPETLQPVLGTSLVLGTVVGLALNLLFRIGARRTRELTVPLGAVPSERIEAFLQASGESWGARADVIGRAKFNLVQSIETILEGCDPEGPLEVEASFDEYHVVIGVSYRGPLLELPEARPTNDEIMETEEGHRRLAGFMLRRYADRVSSTHKAGLSTVTFTFDH